VKASPGLRCHCGWNAYPSFTLSQDQKSAWYRCRNCRHQGPSVAWDGSVGAQRQAAKRWDDDNAMIRRAVGLKPQLLRPELPTLRLRRA
jgi:hypothetical protein